MLSVLKFWICAWAIGPYSGYSFDFNRDYFGVYFNPHIKSKEAGIHCGDPSALEDLMTMSEIICTRFSRILTTSVDADFVQYRKNYTYYHTACARARIAEAAALVNRNQTKKCLSVLIGIYDKDYNFSQEMNTEVNVAVEAAYLAYSIFPGTVEGFVFSQYDMNSLDWAKSTLRWMEELRNLTKFSNFKIGTTQFCTALSGESAGSKAYQISELRKEMIIKSDFILCEGFPNIYNAPYGAKYNFVILKDEYMKKRAQIQAINSKIEVMQLTSWSSDGDNEWDNIENFRDFWEEASKFAERENYYVYLGYAFDTQWASKGWWKLSGDDLIRNPAGYLEKVPKEHEELAELYGTSTALTNNCTPDDKTAVYQRDTRNSATARHFYQVIFSALFLHMFFPVLVKC